MPLLLLFPLLSGFLSSLLSPFLSAFHSARAGGSWIGLLAILAVGFFLGIRHATDPDHVIAVSTIVTRERKIGRAALIGVLWGIGHSVTILVVGAAIILFSVVIPPRIGLTMEFSVGAMLILLGVANLRIFGRSVSGIVSNAGAAEHDEHATIHSHYHAHGDYVHSHVHVHSSHHGSDHGPTDHPTDGPAGHHHSAVQTPLSFLDRLFGRMPVYWIARPVIIGIVHGLAGSAAIALLVLSTIPNPRWAVTYLLIFGLGTVLGMLVITLALASAVSLGFRKGGVTPRRMGLAAGFISLAFGVFLVYQIGFVQGLFTSQPHWIPR